VALLLSVSMAVLAAVEGPVWGWGDPRTLAHLVGAVFTGAVVVRQTLRAPVPIIEKAHRATDLVELAQVGRPPTSQPATTSRRGIGPAPN
jgi:hypothetical protein